MYLLHLYTAKANLTNGQYLMYRTIEQNPGITSKELQTIFSVTRGAVYDRIMFLKLTGLITDKKINPKGLKAYTVTKRRGVWK